MYFYIMKNKDHYYYYYYFYYYHHHDDYDDISVSSGRKYPVYLFHFHAADPLFEWNTIKDIKHNEEAIAVGRYFADFFVHQGNNQLAHINNFNRELK